MTMKFLAPLQSAVTALCCRSTVLLCLVLALTAPASAQVGNSSLTGPAGAFNGMVTSGGSYDPQTGNARRSIVDIEVSGAIGNYPLKFTRTMNSRSPADPENKFGSAGGWSHSYAWEIDPTDEKLVSNFQPDVYSVHFPDGRNIAFTADGNPPVGVAERFVGINASGVATLLLPDGGKVEFGRVINSRYEEGTYYYHYSYFAKAIVDPHGVRTEMSQVLQQHKKAKLMAITQAGDRRIDITYRDIQVGTYIDTVIDRLEASDGRVVQYNYSTVTFGPNTYSRLDSITYPHEPTLGYAPTASYTYEATNVADTSGQYTGTPLLKTADDPMYGGPMKKITYHYATSNADPMVKVTAGQIRSENNGTTGELVSRLNVPFITRRSETRGDGVSRTFIYDGAYLRDEYNFTNQYQRNVRSNGLLTAIIDRNGRQTDYTEHHPIKRVPTVATFPLTADDAGQRATVRQAYDGLYLHSITDESGHTTTYWRNAEKRVQQIAYPGGTTETFYYDNRFGKVYDHQLPSGMWEHFRYDARGLLQEEWNDHDTYAARTVYTYYGKNEAGGVQDMVKTITDGRARAAGAPYSIRFEYNNRLQVTKAHYPATGNSADPTVVTTYDVYGRRKSLKNELGHTSTWDYDDYGRPLAYTEPLNVQKWNGSVFVPSRSWKWSYERVRGTTTYGSNTHTSGNWRTQADPAFDKDDNRAVIVRIHDANDRLSEQQTGWIERPDGARYVNQADYQRSGVTYDANGNTKTTTDPQNRLTTLEYDERNRLKRTIEPLSRITETWYDRGSNRTKVQFPDGTTKRWENYDAFGQAWKTYDERNNLTDLVYERGPMKLLLSLTTYRDRDSGGTEAQTTSFWTDGIGRPWRTNFPDGSYEETTLELGQLKSWKSRKGALRTVVRYDARGREEKHVWDDGITPEVERKWDDASRLTWIRNKFSTIDYGYDDAGQVRWEGTTVAGSGGRAQVSYERYSDGKAARTTYPDSSPIRHDYTARGQLKTVGWDHADKTTWGFQWVNYYYHADGTIYHQDYGNGVRTGFGYDTRGHVSAVHHHYASPPHQNLSYRDYYRDHRDRIFAWKKSADSTVNPMENGRGNRYEYDPEGQLTRAYYGAPDPAATGNNYERDDNFGSFEGWVWGWRGYDALGNRRGYSWLNRWGPTWHNRRDNGLNQYLDWEATPINYDANGSTTYDGWVTASYNALNQPVSISSPGSGGTMWFGYDPLGRCVKRWTGPSDWEGSNPATYLYYDGWKLIVEGSSATQPRRNYIHGARLDEIVIQHALPWAGDAIYMHYDAMGNATLATNVDGSIAEQYAYDAFGQPYFFNAAGQQLGASARGNRFLFTGREWLHDLWIYDFRHRLYHPELGRFLQPDPLGYGAGDANLYRYAGNDPVNNTDPYGLQQKPAPTYQSNVPRIAETETVTVTARDFAGLDNKHGFRDISVFGGLDGLNQGGGLSGGDGGRFGGGSPSFGRDSSLKGTVQTATPVHTPAQGFWSDPDGFPTGPEVLILTDPELIKVLRWVRNEVNKAEGKFDLFNIRWKAWMARFDTKFYDYGDTRFRYEGMFKELHGVWSGFQVNYIGVGGGFAGHGMSRSEMANWVGWWNYKQYGLHFTGREVQGKMMWAELGYNFYLGNR